MIGLGLIHSKDVTAYWLPLSSELTCEKQPFQQDAILKNPKTCIDYEQAEAVLITGITTGWALWGA